MLKYFFACFAILFALQGIAVADFYTWEDDQGNVHITDYPPPAKYGKKIKMSKDAETPQEICIRPEKEKTSADNREAIQEKNQEVILYTTSWCPYCTKARNFFQSRNIPFTEYDVEKDREAAARKRELDPRGGVPFAIINGHPIHGYSESAYERALK